MRSCGKGQGGLAMGLWPRVWGGQRHSQRAGAGVGGLGSPDALALLCIYVLVAPPALEGCRRKWGWPVAGAPPRTPALPAPRLRPAAEHGVRQGRRYGADSPPMAP